MRSFASIGWDEQAEPLDAEAVSSRNSVAERMSADAQARAEKAEERARRKAELAANGSTDSSMNNGSSSFESRTSVEQEQCGANDEVNDEDNDPSSPAVQFLSRQSISEVVEVDGFAKAAAIARERRLQKRLTGTEEDSATSP